MSLNTTSGNNYPPGLTKRHLVNANIPMDYWEADFSTYEGPVEGVAETYRYLTRLKFYKEKGVGLLYAGNTGTGKTSLMSIALKYIVQANWKVFMTSLSELVEAIKRSWDTKDTTLVDVCKKVDYLGLDDLGKEHQGPTGFSAVTFDNLLRHRVQHCLPTFFTTNLNKNQIKDRYGAPALSLIEGKSKVIQVVGSDYRREVLRPAIT